MTTRVPYLVALLLVAAACATPATVDTTAQGSAASTEAMAPASTMAQAESSSTDLENPAPTDTAAPMVEKVAPPAGPPAPEFTLALGDGRSFTLSEEARPVYMVFWAEW